LPTSFGTKLSDSFAKYGQLCVGIDPHAALLDDWGLTDDVLGLEKFANAVLDAAVSRVGIIKPQVSFFERHGSKGFAVLERLAERASQTDLLVIMDAKRGDIGTTMDAYISDALTVSPYLGFGSLKETLSGAAERGKGVFVLAATSNPEGASVQRATIGEVTLAQSMWNSLAEINAVTADGHARYGSFGAVLGATLNLQSFGLGSVLDGQVTSATPILAPGFGAQGADLSASKQLFGKAASQVIHSVSRSVLQSGESGLVKSIEAARAELAIGLG
jgi:orotidine-5'-phosphate decarboxylase